MELKHSLNLLTSRYSVIIKMLIFFIIITAICTAIMVSIMTPAMDPLFLDIENANLVHGSIDIGMDMLTGEITYSDGIELLTGQYHILLNIIETYKNELLIFYILSWFVFFFYRLIVSMTSIPIADSINVYMGSSVHKSIISSFAENLWVSLKYALCATIINSLLNTLFCTTIYYLVIGLASKWGIGALSVGLLLFLIMLSLKYALFLGWVPTIVCEKKKVLVSLVDSVKKCKQWFKYGFLCSFILYLLIIPLNLLFGLATFGILVPIVIVSEMIMLRIIELVCYYNSNKLRYYIDRNTIIKPREELY